MHFESLISLYCLSAYLLLPLPSKYAIGKNKYQKVTTDYKITKIFFITIYNFYGQKKSLSIR